MLGKLAAVATAIFLPFAANAASIITDGNVSLGVDDFGFLNVRGGTPDVVGGTTAVGVRWISPEGIQYESTSHGCLCEGWGVSVNGTTSGYASIDNGGTAGLTVDSFASTATTATSVTKLTGAGLSITHDFGLASETDDLYRVKVTVANTGGTDLTNVTYRRAMDWDTSPTPFDEYVSIGGTATTTLLKNSSDDGFKNVNPLNPITSDLAGCGFKTDFTACGPDDHGAVFDFDLGTLVAGQSYSFDIYYGGAANKAAAFDALGAVGAELYSFGWSYLDVDQNGFSDRDPSVRTPTFIFAFSGVGGTVVVPPSEIPVPAAGLLLVGALGALGALRKRKVA